MRMSAIGLLLGGGVTHFYDRRGFQRTADAPTASTTTIEEPHTP